MQFAVVELPPATLVEPEGVNVEIVVGVNDSDSSSDALSLGFALSRSLHADLVVANIYPTAFDYVSPAHIDAEWRKFLIDQASDAVEANKTGSDVKVDFVIHPHKSSGIGLIEVARQRHAQCIVIGSAPGGSEGRITGGSTSDQLLHASPVPVALAPLGYREWAPDEIRCANVAYQATSESDRCLDLVASTIAASGAQINERLRLVTVIERVTKIYGSRLGRHAEDQVLLALQEQAQASLASAAARVSLLQKQEVSDSQEASNERKSVEAFLLQGENVTTALARRDWGDDDLLVVGSTGAGPIRRVFLGDTAFKLIKAATVPVLVVPRSAHP
jgi:nucleotide-binding universal stress UspA family protein